jgi:hypothetical protein
LVDGRNWHGLHATNLSSHVRSQGASEIQGNVTDWCLSTITDGDLALCESNAIIEYILGKADRDGIDAKQMRPAAGTPERNDYIFWFHSSPGSFQLVMSLYLESYRLAFRGL